MEMFSSPLGTLCWVLCLWKQRKGSVFLLQHFTVIECVSVLVGVIGNTDIFQFFLKLP